MTTTTTTRPWYGDVREMCYVVVGDKLLSDGLERVPEAWRRCVLDANLAAVVASTPFRPVRATIQFVMGTIQGVTANMTEAEWALATERLTMNCNPHQVVMGVLAERVWAERDTGVPC